MDSEAQWTGVVYRWCSTIPYRYCKVMVNYHNVSVIYWSQLLQIFQIALMYIGRNNYCNILNSNKPF